MIIFGCPAFLDFVFHSMEATLNPTTVPITAIAPVYITDTALLPASIERFIGIKAKNIPVMTRVPITRTPQIDIHTTLQILSHLSLSMFGW